MLHAWKDANQACIDQSPPRLLTLIMRSCSIDAIMYRRNCADLDMPPSPAGHSMAQHDTLITPACRQGHLQVGSRQSVTKCYVLSKPSMHNCAMQHRGQNR